MRLLRQTGADRTPRSYAQGSVRRTPPPVETLRLRREAPAADCTCPRGSAHLGWLALCPQTVWSDSHVFKAKLSTYPCGKQKVPPAPLWRAQDFDCRCSVLPWTCIREILAGAHSPMFQGFGDVLGCPSKLPLRGAIQGPHLKIWPQRISV